MTDESTHVRVRLSPSPDGPPVDAQELEQLALRLRADLIDLGVADVERIAAAPAPEGARGIELIGAIELVAAIASTGTSVAQIIDFVRRWRASHDRRRGVSVEVQAMSSASEAPLTGRAGGRSALIVANADYTDRSLSQLRSPGSDARALAEVLGSGAIGGFDVDLLMDADERTVRRRIAAFFANRDPDDLLLLHFSCHGLKDIDGQLYLAAADTELTALTATGVPASFVSGEMSRTVSRRVVLILDCCYSGAFARGSPVRGDSQVHINEYFSGGTGRTVLTASSATEYAFEGDRVASAEAQPSIFTAALTDGLRTGEADLDGDGDISVDELYDYAYRRVLDRRSPQKPQKWSFGTTGAVVIARSPRLPSLPDQVIADMGSDRLVLRLHAVEALTAMLGRERAGMRAAATAALTDLRDHDDSNQVRAAAATALGGADVGARTDRVGSEPIAPVTRAAQEKRRTPPPPVASTRPPSVAPTPAPPVAPVPRVAAAAPAAGRAGSDGPLRVAGWLAAVAGAAWLLLDQTARIRGHGDILLYLPMPLLFAIAGMALIRRPARRSVALALVGASVWVFGDLGYLLYHVADSFHDLIRLMWLAAMLAIVAAAALVVSVHRRAVSARGLLRPAPLAAGAAGGALVVTAVVAVEFTMRDYLLAFAAAVVIFASALVIRPRRLGAAVLIGAIGASVLWLIPDVVDDGTFEESPIAMTVTTGLLVAGVAAAVWLAKRPDPAG